MKRTMAAVILVTLALVSLTISAAQRPPASAAAAQGARAQAQSAVYFPERFDWQHKRPDEVGMDGARVAEAVKVSIDRENPAPRDMTLFLKGSFGRVRFDTLIGPVKDRGGPSGVI